jgi:hypothetical protein
VEQETAEEVTAIDAAPVVNSSTTTTTATSPDEVDKW